jgi:hypothetical protein
MGYYSISKCWNAINWQRVKYVVASASVMLCDVVYWDSTVCVACSSIVSSSSGPLPPLILPSTSIVLWMSWLVQVVGGEMDTETLSWGGSEIRLSGLLLGEKRSSWW